MCAVLYGTTITFVTQALAIKDFLVFRDIPLFQIRVSHIVFAFLKLLSFSLST